MSAPLWFWGGWHGRTLWYTLTQADVAPVEFRGNMRFVPETALWLLHMLRLDSATWRSTGLLTLHNTCVRKSPKCTKTRGTKPRECWAQGTDANAEQNPSALHCLLQFSPWSPWFHSHYPERAQTVQAVQRCPNPVKNSKIILFKRKAISLAQASYS